MTMKKRSEFHPFKEDEKLLTSTHKKRLTMYFRRLEWNSWYSALLYLEKVLVVITGIMTLEDGIFEV